MAMSSFKMYTSDVQAGTIEGAATMDVPEDADVHAIAWSIDGGDAAANGVKYELSLASSSGLATNDTRASISSASMGVAAAAYNMVNSIQMFDPPIRLAGGDRLYIHKSSSQGAWDNLRATCHIYASTKGVARARRL